MNKLPLLFTFLFLSVVGLYAQNDFRKMNWGESPEILKEKYPDISFEKVIESDFAVYTYSDYSAGIEADIIYIFENNAFQFGFYDFTPDRISSYYEDYLRDYNTVSDILSEKYPVNDAHEWFNDTFEGQPNSLGFAISNSHVRLVENAITESGTIISHSLGMKEGSLEHLLTYISAEAVLRLGESNRDDF